METNAEELKRKIREIVGRVLEVEPETISDEAHFVKDLNADSLMALEILVLLEKEFQVKLSEDKLQQMLTLQTAVELMRGIVEQKAA